MTITPPALALALRHATRAAHRALDHHPLLAPLVQPDLRLCDYVQALCALVAPLSALENIVSALAAPFPPRKEALLADIAALGASPLRLQASLPSFPTDDHRWGVLYVLEGSRLGSAVIASRLAVSLPTAPRRFFSNADGARHWPRFLTLLRREEDNLVESACVAGALAAFDFYKRHLDACSDISQASSSFAS